MASEAEAKLGSVSYTGERKKWTWEKYVQIHAEQHAVLNGLTNYENSGINNGTKVRKLMAGIKTDALDTVKAAVLESPALRTNYPDVVTLYGDFIKQQNIESASMNVSDAHITRHHNGPASVAGSDYEASYDGVVEDRFYNHAAYITLSPDQNNELRLKRKHRGGVLGSTPNTLLWCCLFPWRYQTYYFAFLRLAFFVSVLLTPSSVFPGPGSRAGVTPIIWSLNFKNRAPGVVWSRSLQSCLP
jgi:hypothetical protein